MDFFGQMGKREALKNVNRSVFLVAYDRCFFPALLTVNRSKTEQVFSLSTGITNGSEIANFIFHLQLQLSRASSYRAARGERSCPGHFFASAARCMPLSIKHFPKTY